jgi:hypothetical protein
MPASDQQSTPPTQLWISIVSRPVNLGGRRSRNGTRASPRDGSTRSAAASVVELITAMSLPVKGYVGPRGSVSGEVRDDALYRSNEFEHQVIAGMGAIDSQPCDWTVAIKAKSSYPKFSAHWVRPP